MLCMIVAIALISVGAIGDCFFMIIVVAITFISSLIFTDVEMVNGLRYLRLFVLLFGSLFGIYGVLISFIMLLIYLVSYEPFNTPYLYPLVPFNKNYFNEVLFKENSWKRYLYFLFV